MQVEASDPRVADLGTKECKKAKAKELKQGSSDVEETLVLAAIETAATAGEGRDDAAPAKVALYRRAAGMAQGTKDAQIAAQREKEEHEERAVAKKKGNKKKGQAHKDV